MHKYSVDEKNGLANQKDLPVHTSIDQKPSIDSAIPSLLEIPNLSSTDTKIEAIFDDNLVLLDPCKL